MYRQFKNLKQKEKGQGLVEYALILVLVAIVVIAALMSLGPLIGNVFNKVNNSLSGLGGENTQSACEASGGIWYNNLDGTWYCWHGG